MDDQTVTHTPTISELKTQYEAAKRMVLAANPATARQWLAIADGRRKRYQAAKQEAAPSTSAKGK